MLTLQHHCWHKNHEVFDGICIMTSLPYHASTSILALLLALESWHHCSVGIMLSLPVSVSQHHCWHYLHTIFASICITASLLCHSDIPDVNVIASFLELRSPQYQHHGVFISVSIMKFCVASTMTILPASASLLVLASVWQPALMTQHCCCHVIIPDICVMVLLLALV